MAYSDPADPRALEARRRHYTKNKERYKANAKARRQKLREVVLEAKNRPCHDCEESYPHPVMEFHHRNPAEKLGNMSRIIQKGNLPLLLEEIAKCDVLCANCHRIRSYC